jgi:hypothetical protein
MWTKTAVFPACSDFTNSCFSSERRPGTILRRDGAWRFARESQAGLLFNPNQSGRVSVPIYFGAYAIDMRKPSRPAGLEGFLSAKLMAFCESGNEYGVLLLFFSRVARCHQSQFRKPH